MEGRNTTDGARGLFLGGQYMVLGTEPKWPSARQAPENNV